jgi:hypothetical protein
MRRASIQNFNLALIHRLTAGAYPRKSLPGQGTMTVFEVVVVAVRGHVPVRGHEQHTSHLCEPERGTGTSLRSLSRSSAAARRVLAAGTEVACTGLRHATR